jgi:hypothetical protein
VKNLTLALQTLVQLAPEHDARLAAPDKVLFGKLGLFLRVRPIQVGKVGNLEIFIALFDASTDETRSGIGVTCVGYDSDALQAAKDAVAQWQLGVLPVLEHWRGGHTCLAGTRSFETPGPTGPRTFDVIMGPVVERGEHDGGEAALPSTDTYLSLLAEPLRARRLKSIPHWLECFAARSADGSIDATCRLDNRDWPAGQRLLDADARSWPGSTRSLHSRKQFLLVLPHGSGSRELAPRSFWARLFGRD